MRKIFIGADHNGFALKEKLKARLAKKNVVVSDEGNTRLVKDDDYPDYALRVARNVSRGKGEGILICGSGHGMAIAANKLKGIRAAVVHSPDEAAKAREHDFINVLCLPSSARKAEAIVDAWLSSSFSGEPKHTRRIEKIKRMEKPWSALFLR